VSQEPELTSHPLIADLSEDPLQPGGLAVIVGYVGKSQTEGRVRVYLDLTLGAYCEVAREDVVSTAPVDSSDTSSPSIVWINGAARVELVKIARMTAEASFISGAIQGGHLREAVGSVRRDMVVRKLYPGAEPMEGTKTVWCCPVPTLEGACETKNIFCPPREM
jgi:hypothetical protein